MDNPTETQEVHIAEAHHHPTPRQYVQIAVLLAVLTGIEVGLFYTESIFGNLVVPALLVLAALKFGLVVGYYMHLKYEKRFLTRLFGGGFVLALMVYAVVLVAFGIMARL
jgi:cytochrome c oxidase subunit 4